MDMARTNPIADKDKKPVSQETMNAFHNGDSVAFEAFGDDADAAQGLIRATVTTGNIIDQGFETYKYTPEFLDEFIAQFMARQPARRRLPVLNSHDRSAVLGSIHSITREGRLITFEMQFEMANPSAVEIFNLVSNRHIQGVSMGYFVDERERLNRRNQPDYQVTKARLFEVSITAFPANNSARVTSVEADTNANQEQDALGTLLEVANLLEVERQANNEASLREIAASLRVKS